MTDLMRGVTHVRQCIETHLSTKVPELLIVAREQWGLDQYTLPDPKKYNSYDPLTATEYPSIGSWASRTSGWQMQNLNNRGEEEYSAIYAVRLALWVRTPKTSDDVWIGPVYDTCLRVRDDMTAVVRSCILHSVSLGFPGVCRVRSETLSEDYLDAIKGSDGSHWFAGTLFSFDMQMNESNYAPVISEGVTTGTVDAGLIPATE